MKLSSMLTGICIVLAAAAHSDVCGSIEYIGAVRVLNLWGSWEDMGRAHGYLLGPDISEVFHDYFLEMAGGVGNFEGARAFFQAYFQVPQEFLDYTQGMISGIADTISLYSPQLGRDMDYVDICVCSSIPDIAALKKGDLLLCSSVSAWNDATAEDTCLRGAPAISRNLDYYVDTKGTVLDNSILLTFDPDDGQEWVSIGFPGFAGSLSGMNASGISACLNMGNNQGTTQYASPFVPICMALALGLSDTDFDGSGQCDIEDMKEALTCWNRGNSYDIHVVGNRALAGQDSNAVVVEVSNKNGYAFRHSDDEPAISPDRMIVTNHHRVLIPPVSCFRYSYLMDSLTADPDVDLQRFWSFMGAVGWPATPGQGGTLQTMLFMPETLEMGISFSTAATPSYLQEPEMIGWEDIFPNHSPQGIETGSVQAGVLVVYPNPTTGILYVVTDPAVGELGVYDLAGRSVPAQAAFDEGRATVDLEGLPAGIYRILTGDGGNVLSKSIILIGP